MDTILYLTLAYFIGSIPFGLLLTRFAGYGDIRKIGSGNIGATNILRTGNKKLAALTLLLDTSKGVLPTLITFTMSDHSYWPHAVALFVGLFATLGHCFPIWLKFKGGKGVATALGVLLAAIPFVGIATCITWLITAKITKISSLSALIAVGIAPIITLIFYGTYPALICTLISALIFFRHRDNIKRLMNGTEPKIGQKT